MWVAFYYRKDEYMFAIDNGMILLTRGDVATIEVSAMISDTELYTFQPNDKIRFKVFEKKQCESIVMCKDTIVESPSPTVDIVLDKTDTKIGDIINKPKDYWYEVELNPNTSPKTIIGYDESGPKVFRLFPEGDDIDGYSS